MPRIRHARLNSLTAALLLGACATAPAPAAQEPHTPGQRIEPGTSTDVQDIVIPRDGDPAKLASALAALTAARDKDPNDLATRLKLAEAHYVMAESIAVLGWKDQGEATAHWTMSSQAVDGLEDGAAFYWSAASKYALALQSGYLALLDAQPVVERMMAQAVQRAPRIDRGGPYRVLASLAAHPADPSLRDLKRARQLADAALAIDGRSAANVSAFIEHYAVPAQDRAALADMLQLLSELRPAAGDDAVAGMRAEQLAATVEERLE